MDGNLTIFSVGIIVQFRHAFQQLFYDNPMRFDMQYNKFDIFRHSQALSYLKSRPEMDDFLNGNYILYSFLITGKYSIQKIHKTFFFIHFSAESHNNNFYKVCIIFIVVQLC